MYVYSPSRQDKVHKTETENRL